MIIDWIEAATLLAASDESFVSSLMANLLLWGRVALGIGLVIFVHELGHFVAAKTFGVKCEKFYVGFDVPISIGPIKFPRTLGRFRYGETEYGIGIIPLGGYVKMLGQDDDPRKQEQEAERIRVQSEADEPGSAEVATESEAQLDPRSFPAKPVWQRMIIISAGVVMNVITGVLFAAIAYGYGVSYSPAVVGGVTPGGPAWQAGIEPGGKVVSVGTWQDQEMHFREMRMEILTEGLETPDEPVDIAIEYDDGVRNFSLNTQSHPDEEDMRMIGIGIPESTTLAAEPAMPGTAAATVLGPADARAEIVAFDGTAINRDSIDPSAPFLNYLYSNPKKPVSLKLKRADGSMHQVTLPPQKAKGIGLDFAIGEVAALMKGGPADRAGLKVGDRIKRINDNETPDAYRSAVDLVGVTEPVTLIVERDADDDSAAAREVELVVEPQSWPQTIPPTHSIRGDIAINALGFSYRPSPQIVAVDTNEKDSESSLQPGDQLREVQLIASPEAEGEWLADDRFESVFERLKDGWEIGAASTLTSFRDAIQFLPEGTKLRVKATRPPEGRVVESVVTIRMDPQQVMFPRGLALPPIQATQQAGSVSEALSLGMKEGVRQFNNVVRFLTMLPQGRIKLRHVGGPLEIVNIAKNEAEKGISPQLLFLTMLSMNLAILNFLPIPALDGGHMMFLIYEAVAGKRANEQLEFRLTVAGLLTLLTLMVVVFANDILRHL